MAKKNSSSTRIKKGGPGATATGSATNAITNLNDAYLRYLTLKGVKERFGVHPDMQITERIEHELEVITQAGFSSYFLIIWDLMRFCRDSGIPTGPGRGSVCGSLVAYAVYITDVDPLRFGIPFERFLHLERIAMPDIDLDICQARRPEVIEYLHQKYGEDSVAQIITFGTMAAKGVVRDVCRVLHVDEHLSGQKHNHTGEKLAALIPEGSGPDQVYLDDFLASKEGVEFKSRIEGLEVPYNDEMISVLDTCRRLEGLRRHSSVHAAGVVIADRPLIDVVPLYRRNQQSDIQVQFDMWDAEAIGLLKLDVLGLRTVTVIGEAERFIRESGDPDFDIKKVPLDDAPTFDLLSSGNTVGVFQLEGEGITSAVTGVRPDRFEDIIAILALYRPGPMEQLGDYIDRKHGRAEVSYPIPDLAPILERTYGLIVYQEQVMGMARVLAGFTPGEADAFRKAIGKKLPELIKEQIGIFTTRALERGFPSRPIEHIAEQIAYFGRYGFNLGHATGYAYITYWTAYLKANYPTEFVAATLNSHLGDADRIGIILSDASRLGVAVRAPSINDSGRGFTIVGPAEIRFGIAAVKGLGDAMVNDILDERDSTEKNVYTSQRVERVKPDGTPYKTNIKVTKRVKHMPRKFVDAWDFCARLPHIPINVKKSLVMAGAFGADVEFRKQLHEALPDLNEAAKKGRQYDIKNYSGPLPSDLEIIRAEREVMGFYVTEHPLAYYKDDLDQNGAIIDGSFDLLPHRSTIAGIVIAIREHQAKNGQMAWIKLETGISNLPDITVFAEIWKRAKQSVQENEVVICKVVKTSHPKFGNGLQATSVKKLDRARPEADEVFISLPETDWLDIAQIRALDDGDGAKVYVVAEVDGIIALISTGVRIIPTGALLEEMSEIGNVVLDPDPARPLPFGDQHVVKAESMFMGSGRTRTDINDTDLGLMAKRLGGRIVARLDIIDD